MIVAAWDWFIDSAIRALCALWCWGERLRGVPAHASRHRVIPRSDAPEIPLLEQFAVMRMGRWGALYFQRFINPEQAGVFHRHQWRRMRSFVLSGEFTEERPVWDYSEACECIMPDLWRMPRMVTHRRFSTYVMDRSVIHRTHAWGNRCWTLFWMSSPKLEDWGYYEAENGFRFIHWRARIRKQIPSLDKPGELT